MKWAEAFVECLGERLALFPFAALETSTKNLCFINKTLRGNCRRSGAGIELLLLNQKEESWRALRVKILLNKQKSFSSAETNQFMFN